jgi:hypothetical protein
MCRVVKSFEEFRLVKKTNKPHSYCRVCENARDRNRYEDRKEQMLKRKKETYNSEAKRNYNQEYIKNNREKIGIKCKEYYYKNQETLKAQKRKYNIEKRSEILAKKAEYQKNNPEKIAAYSAKRYARKVQASPKWITKEQEDQIRDFYKEARLKTELTGIKHEVDHIVPIKGKNVTGLHVPWNLRVVTKSENCSKGNKLIEEIL